MVIEIQRPLYGAALSRLYGYRAFRTSTRFITFTANPNWPGIVDNLLPGDQIESTRMLFNCLLKFSSKEQGRLNQQKPMMDLQKCALLCMAWHSTALDGHEDAPIVGRRTGRGLKAQPIFQKMKIPATCVTRERAANALLNKWAQEID